jgi:hypothetical protein
VPFKSPIGFQLSANASAAMDEVLRGRRRHIEYVVVAEAFLRQGRRPRRLCRRRAEYNRNSWSVAPGAVRGGTRCALVGLLQSKCDPRTKEQRDRGIQARVEYPKESLAGAQAHGSQHHVGGDTVD